MSYNLNLLELFLDSFFKSEILEMDHFFAPTFKYVLNQGAEQSFEEFAERMKFVSQTTDPAISQIKTADDQHFHYNFEVRVPGNTSKDTTAYGSVEIIIAKSLIQRVNVDYHKTKEEFEKFQALLESSRVTFI